MTGDIALWLIQDGVINGAIYVLMALALLLVFAVTRIIFVPQGEFVALAGLTLGTLQLGKGQTQIWSQENRSWRNFRPVCKWAFSASCWQILYKACFRVFRR